MTVNWRREENLNIIPGNHMPVSIFASREKKISRRLRLYRTRRLWKSTLLALLGVDESLWQAWVQVSWWWAVNSYNVWALTVVRDCVWHRSTLVALGGLCTVNSAAYIYLVFIFIVHFTCLQGLCVGERWHQFAGADPWELLTQPMCGTWSISPPFSSFIHHGPIIGLLFSDVPYQVTNVFLLFFSCILVKLPRSGPKCNKVIIGLMGMCCRQNAQLLNDFYAA